MKSMGKETTWQKLVKIKMDLLHSLSTREFRNYAIGEEKY